jgi:general secretion pathway protein B
MSFILDALKKSETDRQRQNGPALFEVKAAPPRHGLPLWAVGLAVLLAINLIIVAWVLLRRPAQADANAAQSGQSSQASSGQSAGAWQGGQAGGGGWQGGQPGGQGGQAWQGGQNAQNWQGPPPGQQGGQGQTWQAGAPGQGGWQGGGGPPGQGAPQWQGQQSGQGGGGYPSQPGAMGPSGTMTGGPGGAQGQQGAPMVPAGGTAPMAPLGQPAGPTAPGQMQQYGYNGTAGAPGDTAERLSADDYAPATDPPPAAPLGNRVTRGTSSGVPLYQDAALQNHLPELRLDLHVFAALPQNRFVMINMHKLREGDSLPEGVRVESIIPEGAVLSKDGTRFLLPRQ